MDHNFADNRTDLTITNDHTLAGLIRKRQEVAAELDAAQSRVRQLILDIDAVDATIRLFQPDIDLDVVKVGHSRYLATLDHW